MPHSSIDTVLGRLDKVKPNGKGGYRARCPAHEDSTPSLSVTETADRILVNCHAGCTTEAVVNAIGLTMADLFLDSPGGNGRKFTKEGANAALTNRGLRPETIRYFHIAANLEKQAWEFPLGQDAGLKFKSFAPNGKGPKNWVPTGTKLGVYHLKPCAGKDEAWVAEGEPDVWIAHQAGLLAFTFTGGAGNVPKGAVEEVGKAGIGILNIVYDNDSEGRAGAQKAARELQAAGVKVRIRRLPESVGDKGDVTTLYNALGGNDEEFRRVMQALPEVAETPTGDSDSDGVTAGSTIVKRLSDVEPEQVQWLWQGRIPLGKITVLDGDPGTGKTTLMLDVAARVTTGRPMPDKSLSLSGGVLVLTAEDGLADTIRPRLDAMAADPTRVFAMAIQGTDGFEVGVTLPEDIARVRQVIEEHDIILVIVDPLAGFLSDSVDSHKDSPVRRALAPLAHMAEETGVAIVAIRHLNKSMSGKALYRGGGSIAIAAAARSVLLAAEDPEDPIRRVLASVKNNLVPPQPSLAYHLEADLAGASRVIWDGESKFTANVLCTQPGDPDERSAEQEVADLLRDLLEVPRTVKEIRKAVRDAGHDVSDKTLQRARRRIGAEVERSGFGGEVKWSLPPHSGHIVDTTETVSTMEAEPPETPVKTPAAHSGHLHSGQPPVSTMGADDISTDPDDQTVLRMVRQYAHDHLGCSPEEIIGYLSTSVSRAKSEIAVDFVAKEYPWLARGEAVTP